MVTPTKEVQVERYKVFLLLFIDSYHFYLMNLRYTSTGNGYMSLQMYV